MADLSQTNATGEDDEYDEDDDEYDEDEDDEDDDAPSAFNAVFQSMRAASAKGLGEDDEDGDDGEDGEDGDEFEEGDDDDEDDEDDDDDDEGFSAFNAFFQQKMQQEMEKEMREMEDDSEEEEDEYEEEDPRMSIIEEGDEDSERESFMSTANVTDHEMSENDMEAEKNARTSEAKAIKPREPRVPSEYDTLPINQDPRFSKFFRMLNVGLPDQTVWQAMERAFLQQADPEVPAVDVSHEREVFQKNGLGLADLDVNLPWYAQVDEIEREVRRVSEYVDDEMDEVTDLTQGKSDEGAAEADDMKVENVNNESAEKETDDASLSSDEDDAVEDDGDSDAFNKLFEKKLQGEEHEEEILDDKPGDSADEQPEDQLDIAGAATVVKAAQTIQKRASGGKFRSGWSATPKIKNVGSYIPQNEPSADQDNWKKLALERKAKAAEVMAAEKRTSEGSETESFPAAESQFDPKESLKLRSTFTGEMKHLDAESSDGDRDSLALNSLAVGRIPQSAIDGVTHQSISEATSSDDIEEEADQKPELGKHNSRQALLAPHHSIKELDPRILEKQDSGTLLTEEEKEEPPMLKTKGSRNTMMFGLTRSLGSKVIEGLLDDSPEKTDLERSSSDGEVSNDRGSGNRKSMMRAMTKLKAARSFQTKENKKSAIRTKSEPEINEAMTKSTSHLPSRPTLTPSEKASKSKSQANIHKKTKHGNMFKRLVKQVEKKVQHDEEKKEETTAILKDIISRRSSVTENMKLKQQYRSYKEMIANVDDDLPPGADVIDEIEQNYEGDKVHETYNEARMKMLEDGRTESEIVAFFEGLTLYEVKIRSLQTQIEALKSRNQRAKWGDALARLDVMERESNSVANVRSSKAARSMSLVHNVKAQNEFKHLERQRQMKAGSARKVGGVSSRGMSSLAPIGEDVTMNSKNAQKIPSPSDRRGMLKKTKKDKSYQQMSCQALSLRKIIDDPNVLPETERVLRELMEMNKKRAKLERQLNSAGIKVAEDIPYAEAKMRVQQIARRMAEIGSSEVEHPDKKIQKQLREEYFVLEQDMEKYNTALMATDEYIEEQRQAERQWEESCAADNLEALRKIRRHMPVNIKRLSEAELINTPTPNGKFLPKKTAQKFKRVNVLQLLRMDPGDITRSHPASLENFRVTGLTLSERRAIYCHIKECGEAWKKNKSEPMTERKYTWFNMMRDNFKSNLGIWTAHCKQFGPPDNHVGCTAIGNQCPLKADKVIDYDGDYGFPDGDVYEKSDVKKADVEDSGEKAAREARELAKEKKAAERQEGLKKHYKKKILDVAKASGSCEAMDACIDLMETKQTTWVEKQLKTEGKALDDGEKKKEISGFNEALNTVKLSLNSFAERSGMKTSGAKGSKSDPDTRSEIELKLCEDVHAAFQVFSSGIIDRMKEISFEDKMVKTNISNINEMFGELHNINVATMKSLGVEKYDNDRTLKSRKVMLENLKKKVEAENAASAPAEDEMSMPERPPAMGGVLAGIAGRGRGGNNDLMSAIAARGRGRGGGRNDLMGAIAARGRGGRGGGGGRDDLLGAIAARGRGGRGGGGGRDDLLGAIAARGRGGSARGGGGGRDDLLGAIAARGRGGGGGRGAGGGRSDLMAAIAARGNKNGSD